MEPRTHTIQPEELLSELAWVRELARGLVRDPASVDDLVQDTWIAAATQRPPGLERSRLRGWLATVVRNLARREGRTSERRRRRERATARPEAQEDDVVARASLQAELTQVLMELEEPLRSTLLLRYLDGLAAPEIARRQGVSPAAVRQRLSRGLASLRERLDRRHGGDRERWFLALHAWLDGGAGEALVAPASKAVLTGSLAVLLKLTATVAAAALLWLGWSLFDTRSGLPVASDAAEISETDSAKRAQARNPTPLDSERSESGGSPRRARWRLVDEHGRPREGFTVLALEHGAWRATRTSDTHGEWELAEELAVDTLVVARAGFRPLSIGMPLESGAALIVPSGASVSGTLARLDRDGPVRLTLEDDEGAAELARLDARALAELELLGVEPRRRTLALDDSGRFRFEGLSERWSGALELAGGWSFVSASAPAQVEPPQLALLLAPATELALVAQAPLRVHGRVVRAGRSEGLANVAVHAQRIGFSAGFVHDALTGPDGDFTLEIPRRGLHRESFKALLRLELAGAVHRRNVQIESARLEQERELGTFELELGRRVVIGVRDGNGTPIAGARVQIPQGATGSTGADGRVELEVPGAGETSLHVAAHGHRPVRVSLYGEDVLEVVLTATNRIDVRVLDELGAPWGPGELRLACPRTPFASAGAPVEGPFELVLPLDQRGECTLSDLLPGIELELTSVGDEANRRLVRAPSASEALTVELVRRRAPVGFSGRVRDLSGNPLPRCRVSASWQDQSVELDTDGEGRFEARLRTPWSAIDVLEVSRAGCARAVLEELALPGDGAIEVVLEPGRDLEVLVLDAQGSPLDLPLLLATMEDGREFEPEPLGGGRHAFAGMPALGGWVSARLCGVATRQAFGPAESRTTLRLPPMAELELTLAPEVVDPAALTCAVIHPLDLPDTTRRMYFSRSGAELAPLRIPVAAGRYSIAIERRRPGSAVEVVAAPREFELPPSRKLVLTLP